MLGAVSSLTSLPDGSDTGFYLLLAPSVPFQDFLLYGESSLALSLSLPRSQKCQTSVLLPHHVTEFPLRKEKVILTGEGPGVHGSGETAGLFLGRWIPSRG